MIIYYIDYFVTSWLFCSKRNWPIDLLFNQATTKMTTVVVTQSSVGGDCCEKQTSCTLKLMEDSIIETGIDCMIPARQERLQTCSWWRISIGSRSQLDRERERESVYLLIFRQSKSVSIHVLLVQLGSGTYERILSSISYTILSLSLSLSLSELTHFALAPMEP